METATVEQAEPQGSAAPTQDTSAPASGTPSPASGESFGSLFRQFAERKSLSRAGVSSAEQESSATDEQPAPSSRTASRPGAATAGADGTASVDAEPSSPTTQPRLSRAQRRAQYTGQQGEPSPADASQTDTAGSGQSAQQPAGEPTAEPSTDDPIVARVAQVEKTVTEGMARLEGLLKSPSPAEADTSLDPESATYARTFGDDAEFKRRADLALKPNAAEPLSYQEAEELEVWANNREVRELAATRVNRQYQSNFSAMVLAAAEEFGIDASAIQKPGTTFRDIFGAFVSQGETRKSAETVAAQERIAKLEAANRLLADEIDAVNKRVPGASRSILAGGASASSRAAALADRSKQNGLQTMRNGLVKQSTGRSGRPGAR